MLAEKSVVVSAKTEEVKQLIAVIKDKTAVAEEKQVIKQYLISSKSVLAQY